jgi:hypothetical protein
LKTFEFFNCGKKGQYSTNCSAPRKNDNENSNMVSKADLKNLFQSCLKDMLTKKEKQTKKKENMEVNDESLGMNVFEKSWKVRTHKLRAMLMVTQKSSMILTPFLILNRII